VLDGILPNNTAETIRGYYYSFIYHLDPTKVSGLMNWPQWTAGKKLVNVGAITNSYTTDNFIGNTYQFLNANVAGLSV
jgi:hypothetical protein